MRKHRHPRATVSKQLPPGNFTPELHGLIDLLRDNLRRADAFVSTAERQIEEAWHDDDGDDDDVEKEFDAVLRHRMRVEYLVEAGKLAVRAALFTTEQIDAVIAAHKRRV